MKHRISTRLGLIALGFIAITLAIGPLMYRAAAQSSTSVGGVFNPIQAYVVEGVWTYKGASPMVFTGASNNANTTTLTITQPTAARTWTLADATDQFVGRATTDTLTNKTLTAPILSGSVTGTYTLAGTPTFTSPTITGGTMSATVYTAPNIQPSVNASASATPTLTAAQCGQIFAMDRASATNYTLPVPVVGCTFDFVYTVTQTSGTNEVQTSSSSVFIQGVPLVTGTTTAGFACNGTTHLSIKSNDTTTGGLLGGHLRFTALTVTLWDVQGVLVGFGLRGDAVFNDDLTSVVVKESS